MKRFLALILSIIMILSCPVYALAESLAEQTDPKIEILTDLGMIEKYEPNADVTREMMVNAVEKLYGMPSYNRYLEERDMSLPVLYGQMLMILVDMTGYYPYIDMYKLDANDCEAYLDIAIKSGLTDRRMGEFDAPVKVEDYAELLYNALMEVDLLKFRYEDGNKQYYVDDDNTLLKEALELDYKDGIVTGVNMTSFDSRESGRKNAIAVDGVWYSYTTDKDPMSYLGLRVRIFYDDEEDIVYSISVNRQKNEVITVSSGDIYTDTVKKLSLSYQPDGKKKKSIDISTDADFIYNRKLLKAYTENDLKLDDCDYRFIDNNADGKVDVIIADQYGTFMVDAVIVEDEKLIDTGGNVYEFENYLSKGYKIFNGDKKSVTVEDLGQYNIISYQKSRDGEYTNFIFSAKSETGILSSQTGDWRYVTVSGAEYECLSQYCNNRADFDKITVGDEVKLFMDFRGFVAEIRHINSPVKAGYALNGYMSGDEIFRFRMLTEDGAIEVFETAQKVVLNNKRESSAMLNKKEVLFDGDKFKPQLILYKASGEGRIFKIETAVDEAGIGHRSDSSQFTLDYDSDRDTPLRILSFNGKKVFGSKYLPDTTTKVFGVSTELNECYVQNGSSLGTGTSYNAKLYNVGEDYVPQYIVLDISPKMGAWVDWTKKTYIVDGVWQVYDEEEDAVFYQLNLYDGKGNYETRRIRDGELKTPGGNPLSGDERLRKVMAKDLKKGTVLQFNDNKYGISSISVQAIPMSDNSEKMFEKSNSTTSYEYGIDTYIFNGSSICAYGEVLARIPAGIVVNNHIPTSVEAAQGGVFPMESWNRVYPLTASDRVWFYEKSSDELRFASASEIIEGDMIFMHRSGGTINTAIIYRQ